MAEQKQDRIGALIREVATGEQKRDTLQDFSYQLEGEAQAMYFSNMRRNMRTRTALLVMNHAPDMSELRIMRA